MSQEIRFGGTASLAEIMEQAGSGIASLPRTEAEFQARYADVLERRPAWVKRREAAANQLRSTPEGRETYGDPERGGTLPQAWRLQFAFSGLFQTCLLARGRPSTPTEGIPSVVLIAPADLVGALARGFDEIEQFDAQLFVHDGRMGHSIRALRHDPQAGMFTYFDPWPERSLLCREFNLAGVDAQPTENGLWRITDAELASVIFASFMMPTHWAQLTGRPFRIAYSALQQTDFWKAFHLHEVARLPDNTRSQVVLKTGGFQKEIELRLGVDAGDMVRDAWLTMQRGWVVGPPQGVNPLAVNIARSFIRALVPEPDREEGAILTKMVSNIPTEARALVMRRDQPDLSKAEELQLTYLGLREKFSAPLPFCRLDLQNKDWGQEQGLCLTIGLDLY
jgi:hypothetical protein